MPKQWKFKFVDKSTGALNKCRTPNCDWTLQSDVHAKIWWFDTLTVYSSCKVDEVRLEDAPKSDGLWPVTEGGWFDIPMSNGITKILTIKVQKLITSCNSSNRP